MSIGAGQVTRFGIGGGIWRPLDSSLFANKVENTDITGGGISKRKKHDEYKKAFDLAKWRKDQREAIESAVSREVEGKPKLKLKKSVKPELSKPEIEQLASIDEPINRQLAIEFELRRLYKRKQDEALAVLLLM